MKNSRRAFVGHVTRLISKIETCIFNSDKVEKILCLKEQLAVILDKLKKVNNKFISLNENAEDYETANEIYFEQNSRVLNTNEIIGKCGPEITPYLDTFYAVRYLSLKLKNFLIIRFQ